MSLRRQKRARLTAAWMCLLAVAFLYAPLAGAAVLARGADCCASGYCKIPAHHHGKQSKLAPEQQAPEKHSEGMTCEHQMGGMAMEQCSMSCCQDPSRPVLMPVAFVLPAASFAPEPGEMVLPLQTAGAIEISRFVEPLSPPPRVASSVC